MLQGSPRSPLRVLATRLVTRETEVLTLAESQGMGQVSEHGWILHSSDMMLAL